MMEGDCPTVQQLCGGTLRTYYFVQLLSLSFRTLCITVVISLRVLVVTGYTLHHHCFCLGFCSIVFNDIYVYRCLFDISLYSIWACNSHQSIGVDKFQYVATCGNHSVVAGVALLMESSQADTSMVAINPAT